MADDPQANANATPSQAFQFGLKTLFALPLLLVAYFALAHWLGLCPATALTIPLGLVFACFYRPLRQLAIGILIAYLLVVLLIPLGRPGGAPRRSQCANTPQRRPSIPWTFTTERVNRFETTAVRN